MMITSPDTLNNDIMRINYQICSLFMNSSTMFNNKKMQSYMVIVSLGIMSLNVNNKVVMDFLKKPIIYVMQLCLAALTFFESSTSFV